MRVYQSPDYVDRHDVEQPVKEVYMGDDMRSHTTSVTGPTVHHKPRKSIFQNRWCFGLGLIVIVLAGVPILLFGLKRFSILKDSSSETSSDAIANDNCLSAIWLASGDIPFQSTTIGAHLEDDDGVEICGVNIPSGPGIWFKVSGSGVPFKIVRHDERPFTNQMSVYQGDCGSLKCVAGDSLKGTVFWNTRIEETYFVRVSGAGEDVGNFQIQLEEFDEVADYGTALNDNCEESIGLATDGSFYVGTTETASFDMEGAGSCYKTTNAGPGVWYNVLGTGGTLIASTNTSEALLGIFTGECGKLNCITASDTALGVDPVVQWNSEEGVKYHILTHSMGGEVATPFEISIAANTQGNHFNINDFCKGAIGPVASDGSILRGSTEFATLDRDGAGSCYPEELAGDGVWYAVHGTGHTLGVFSTADSSIVPLVSVFYGSCRKLLCVEGMHYSVDDDEREVLSWQSDEEETYYLLVRGKDYTKGSFELVIESLEGGTTQEPTQESTEKPEDNSTGEPTEKPTAKPTAEEDESTQEPTDESTGTEAPSDHEGETDAPVEEGAESSPTATPTQPVPTAAPVKRPVNDFCDSAIQVPYPGYVTIDSTENATNYMDGIGRCHSQKNAGPGMWYRIEGNGDRFVAMTTDNSVLDAFISVYSGDCESLFCVADVGGDTRPQRSFTWDTEEGVVYFVLIQGIFGQKGKFELLIDKPNTDVEPASNDFCYGALGPIPSNGTMWSGSTERATVDTEGVGSCYGSNFTGIGVWYTTAGTGGTLDILAKGRSGFAIAVAVFDGFGCDSLRCVTAQYIPGNKAGVIQFETIKDAPYYVLIHGVGDEIGSFELMVLPERTIAPTVPTEPTDPVEGEVNTKNDRCQGTGGPLASNGTKLVATTETSLVVQQVRAGSCSSDAEGGRGLWYSVQGSGSVIRASTVELTDSAPIGFSVFSGSCDTLSCVDGTADKTSVDGEKTIYWESKIDQIYHIYVHSPRNQTGSFELKLQNVDAIPPENDVCQAALPVAATYGTSIKGTTAGAGFDVTSAGNCHGQTGVGPGVWYRIAGNGNIQTLIRDEGSPLSTAISVYRGSCDQLKCVSGNSRGPMSWQSIDGQDHYILVQGSTADTGEFKFNVVESPATSPPTHPPTPQPTSPPNPEWLNNDQCTSALGPLPRSSRYFGTFEEATVDTAGTCGAATNSNPGVWFTFTGTGGGTRISTCQTFTMGIHAAGTTPTKTSVSVFTDGCSRPQCLVGSNNTCSVSGLVNWNTEKGETYHVLVTSEGLSQSETYVFLQDETEWNPYNCLGVSEEYEKQLHALSSFFISSGNTRLPAYGPLPGKDWLSGCYVCDNWGGIQCDKDSQVTEILLAGQSPPLTGRITPYLRDLMELVVLDLSDNNLRGGIPREINGLKNLQNLNLRGNALTGTLPANLLKLRDIVNVDLQNNRLSGFLPDDLGMLPSMEILSLANNTFFGSIPSSLGNAASLTSLKLDNNGLSGTIPTELGSLRLLTTLHLHSNNFIGTMPADICRLRSSGSLVSLTADCGGTTPRVSCPSDCCTQCV